MSIRNFVFFMSGQLGIMLLARYFFQWILHFANQPIGNQSSAVASELSLFSPALVGAVLLGFRVLDAISDPLAGMLSDSWVRRGHQRRTLLLWWFLIPAVGLVVCFLPTSTMTPFLRWMVLIVGMSTFFLGYTFYAIPYWSLVEDYARGDQRLRGRLSNLLGFGLMLATALGFVVTPILVEKLGFVYTALLVACFAIVAMVLPYFAQPSSPAEVKARSTYGRLHWREIWATLQHRQFLALCILYVGSQMSLTIMTSAAPFVAVRLLAGSESDVALLMGPLLGFALLTFIVVPKVSRKFGWERSSVVASILLALVYLLGLTIGMPVFFSAFGTAIVVFSLAGPFIAVLLGVEAEAIAACARDSEGQNVSCYFGVFNLIVKAGNGLAIFAAGILVELSRGSLGSLAIRGMLVAAAGSLILGVACYFFLSRRAKVRAARQCC